MKVVIITFCLIGAAFANPISHNVLVSSESKSNSTESLPVLESSENNTSELQSSEENTSNQSSESESVESTSEDKTSEESDSQSDENDAMDSLEETKDNSMGSEENVRKQSWVRVFASVVKGVSAEDNTSTKVKGRQEFLSNELSDKPPTHTKTSTNQRLVEKPADSSETTSDSTDTSESSDVTAPASDSTSSESQESQEASDSNDSSAASQSTEDSDASDSAELEQVRAKDCANSTQSCESEEYFLQSIGDDAHSPVEHLMVPDEDDRELRLRR
ncbi:secretory calcium-binding phosphoprotein 1 [Fundulus diaphanus]